MSTADNDINTPVCANCGKEGANNTCNKCKMVKYCNAVCKKVHKKKHKKDCEEYSRIAAKKHDEELRIAAEKQDEELFKQPPPLDGDCPICFLRIPSLNPSGKKYMTCCGKVICSGCCYAPVYDNQGNKIDNTKCPFCRAPEPNSKEKAVENLKKRVRLDDPIAVYNVGVYYYQGLCGFPKDYTKALELFQQAGDLGHVEAYLNIGYAYNNGLGVEVDKKKANHYWELAAMGGNTTARYNLGIEEEKKRNMDRALKHNMIAVRSGYYDSLKKIQDMYSFSLATKEDYTKALRSYQTYLGEIKSRQRDEAAAAHDEYKYYESGV